VATRAVAKISDRRRMGALLRVGVRQIGLADLPLTADLPQC